MSEPKAKRLDRDELRSHVVGYSMFAAEQPGRQPLAGLTIGLPITVPDSGWGQVAHLRCGDGEQWWVSVIEGTELPGGPVWVWLLEGEDRQELLRETTIAQLQAHGETPSTVLLGNALPVLHRLMMHQPVWRAAS